MTDDLISRKAAIDALKALEFCVYMDFGEYIGEDTREVRLIRAEKAQDALENLPSAQPDPDVIKVIRCKDCKWKQGAECVRFADVRPFPDDFCSRAERREEGEQDDEVGS